MRLGHVELSLGHADVAAERSATRCRGRSGRAISARVCSSVRRSSVWEKDAAAEAYRRALAIVPGAQSATLALAAVEFRQGSRDEQSGSSARTARPRPMRPILVELLARRLPAIDALMNAMREAIK